MSAHTVFRTLPVWFSLLLLSGCTAGGMFAQQESPCAGEDCLLEPYEVFERGRPNVVVDSVGWVFGIPNRLFLWNWDVQNHDISLETEQQLRQYVAVNGLDNVKVRLNQYDPGGEWQRLVSNKRVGPVWRYTVGAVTTLGYTVFPGRVFRADYYNPFTNTVNVYSDVPALGLREVAYAADVAESDLPGTYAFSQMIPGVNLVHETIATRNVLDYVDATGDFESRQETVHVLYPSYAGAVGSAVGYYVPVGGSLFQLGGLAAGHIAGRWETRGWNRSTEAPLLSESKVDTPSTPAAVENTTVENAVVENAMVENGVPADEADAPQQAEPTPVVRVAAAEEPVETDGGTTPESVPTGVIPAGYEVEPVPDE